MEADSRGSVLVCDVATDRAAMLPQQWRITSCDRVFSELSGACYNSLLGRDLHTILHPAPVLHDSAGFCRCRLQTSTHWFVYAPDLPPVVMTTTLLPPQALQAGPSPGGQRMLVACHFSRCAVPASQFLDVKPSSVPCSPLFYDAASYDKSLYVKTWSMTSSSSSASSSESPGLSRSQISPRSFDSKVVNSELSVVSRKPPLAPDPPRRRSMESASGCTCASATGIHLSRAPTSSCPPSSHAATDLSSVHAGSNLQSEEGKADGEAGSVSQSESHSNLHQQHPASTPSIPNEMGSRSLFLANMSHELRTPLNGTVAMVELLLGTNVSPEQRDLLKMVLESSQSLTRILSSILDFAQLDSGLVELSRSPLNICDMMESCIDMVWPDALKKGLEVTVSAPRAAMTNTVLGDDLRIRQILVHLLSNAVKFTDQGSVEIEVEAEETDTALNCAIKVKDTGIGVPESFHPFLFDSFTQATESCTRTHGGLGLGLAICLNLARLMHADLSISNRDGGGSTATLTLCMPLATGSCRSRSSDVDFISGSDPEGVETKDGQQSPKDGQQSPSASSSTASTHSTGGRRSTDSTESSGGYVAGVGEKQIDASCSAAFSKASDAAVSLYGTDTGIPQLLADSRIRLLQRHSAVIHTHSTVVSRQLRCACSALGMAVLDMPVMNSPQSLEESVRGKPDTEQIRGTPILFCNATDAATALRNGWKKHPVVALCVDGRLPHMLRVHVTPVAMPVKLRELISAMLLTLHGGPGKDSMLHVPLGTPKTIATSAGVACTAGFGGTACGFCTRCQRSTDAAAAALQRRSLDNSALERFPQRLSTSARLTAVVEGNDSSISQSCNSCASSESNWAATETSALDHSRSDNSRNSMGAEGRTKSDFVSSAAGTESDTSCVGQLSAVATMSPLRSLTKQASKGSVESYKLPLDALDDLSNSPVRSDQNAVTGKVRTSARGEATVASVPEVSVCEATALFGAQMQQERQGTSAQPVRVVPVSVSAATSACMQSQPPALSAGMRRSISASSIVVSSRQAAADKLWPQHRNAMQSFLYRSANEDVPAASGDAGSAASSAASQRVGVGQAASPPLRAAGKAPSKAGGKKFRLLIAEDNKINQMVVQKVVRKVSPACEIDVVENGEAALLTILERPGYDLVLMDIHMPKMDGLETTRRVREKHPTRPTIVALTADTVVGMRQKCLQAGMQDYITKPFHVKDMQRILQEFLL